MAELQAQRTLVKSTPELWAEVSDPNTLARHLGEFGEIRITRTDPETIVAWEGTLASGTIELAKSGWGTKITLTAELALAEVEPEPAPVVEPEIEAVVEPVVVSPPPPAEPEPVAPAPEPVAMIEPTPAPKRGFFARLFGREKIVTTSAPVAIAAPIEPVALIEVAPEVVEPATQPAPIEIEEPAATVEPVLEPTAPAFDSERAQELLGSVLDTLGAAHHRPFSRG